MKQHASIDKSLLQLGFSVLDTNVIGNYFKPWEAQKGPFLKVGQTCDFIIFVTEGYGKIIIGNEGSSQVRFIARPGVFLSCLYSFMYQVPSEEEVIGITKMKGFVLHYADFQAILDLYSDLDIAKKLAFAQVGILNELLDEKCKFLVKNAKERYLLFCEQYPDLTQVLPIQDIASFIGIKRQSLSRIRKDLL